MGCLRSGSIGLGLGGLVLDLFGIEVSIFDVRFATLF